MSCNREISDDIFLFVGHPKVDVAPRSDSADTRLVIERRVDRRYRAPGVGLVFEVEIRGVAPNVVGRIVDELVKDYDLAIFDSPPVAVVTDAVLLSSTLDATLVVVGAKMADKKVLQSAWNKLKRSSRNVVGAVLNGFDPVRMYTSYGYYTYRYHYYYSDGQKLRRKLPSLTRKRQQS